MSALEDYRIELRGRLEALSAAGLQRRLRSPAGIDLTSNDSLGLADHPRLREHMRAALLDEPAGAGGSRLLRGQRDVFARLERRLAAFCGREAALLFGSGWAANTGLLQALLGPDDLALSDAANHASLIDGLRLSGARKVVYPHQDLGAVAAGLRLPRRGRAFVVTESLFGMDGDLTPLRELAGLCGEADALLIVDEAHATGVFGAGRVAELGLCEQALCSVHTGGKALGSGGAWVAGPAELIELLVQRARPFVFSTAPLPALAAALEAALDVLRDEPWRPAELLRKSALLRAALAGHGVPVGGEAHILSLVVGANEAAVALQERLAEAGFDARAVRPPTVPPGTARLRLSVRAPLPDEELLRFAAAVAAARLDLGLAEPAGARA